jgi:basic amino acid/polyamine antiporter, APA family
MATSKPTNEKPALLRQIGLTSATALVISNMVGTGIFTTTGFLAGDLGDLSLVLGIWIAGAICALAGAFCYSELGINFPSSGGEYVYLTEAFGPAAGFMVGWISFVAGFSGPIALAAVAFAEYVGYFFPAVKMSNAQEIFAGIKVGPGHLVACALVTLFTILNMFGVGRIAKLQNVLTGIKLAVIIGFIVLGFTVGQGNWANFSQNAVRTSSMSVPSQFSISLIFIYLAYSGWNAATYVAEEVQNPERTLPLALTLGTIIVTVLFVGLNLVFIYAQPLEQMKGVVAIGALSASHLFGPQISGVFGVLMAVSLMATVNAMVTIGPRVYYAMAKNKAFFPAAAIVHEKWRTPVNAILMQGVFTIFMTLTPFKDLIFFIGFLLNAFSVIAVGSLFIFRKRPGWQKLGVVNFAWPLIPVFYILVGSWIAFQGIQMNPTVSLACLGTVAVGAIAYQLWLAPKKLASDI